MRILMRVENMLLMFFVLFVCLFVFYYKVCHERKVMHLLKTSSFFFTMIIASTTCWTPFNILNGCFGCTISDCSWSRRYYKYLVVFCLQGKCWVSCPYLKGLLSFFFLNVGHTENVCIRKKWLSFKKERLVWRIKLLGGQEFNNIWTPEVMICHLHMSQVMVKVMIFWWNDKSCKPKDRWVLSY